MFERAMPVSDFYRGPNVLLAQTDGRGADEGDMGDGEDHVMQRSFQSFYLGSAFPSLPLSCYRRQRAPFRCYGSVSEAPFHLFFAVTKHPWAQRISVVITNDTLSSELAATAGKTSSDETLVEQIAAGSKPATAAQAPLGIISADRQWEIDNTLCGFRISGQGNHPSIMEATPTMRSCATAINGRSEQQVKGFSAA
jgi:hypothetical protein